MLVGDEHTVDVVRCTSCRARSIGNIVVRDLKLRRDVPEVRAVIAASLRKRGAQQRREAELLSQADECDAEAARWEQEP
jgi:predicted sugar kinase